jgi:tetratricopeptide (TPR) repeat protein
MAAAQSDPPAPTSQQANPHAVADWQLTKPEVSRLIALNEAAAHDKVTIADRPSLVLVYSNLGALYADAGMTRKAEAAAAHAVDLLEDGPQARLAEELGQLAVLRVAKGDFHQAEKDELRSFHLREALGDPVSIARAQSELAGLFDLERKPLKALGFAEAAYKILGNNHEVSVSDRASVMHTLGFALTGTGSCDRGIQLLKDALELVKKEQGTGGMGVGFSEYMLGYGYWHCRDRKDTEEWMQRGTTDMSGEFGWGHNMYLSAMREYARFLRMNGELEAALSAQAVVNRAESVVDVNALASERETFRSTGSR